MNTSCGDTVKCRLDAGKSPIFRSQSPCLKGLTVACYFGLFHVRQGVHCMLLFHYFRELLVCYGPRWHEFPPAHFFVNRHIMWTLIRINHDDFGQWLLLRDHHPWRIDISSMIQPCAPHVPTNLGSVFY